MAAARARGKDVLVTFGAHRGCYDGARYSRAPACRAPSAAAYRAAFRAFDDRYPWVRTYSAWNEVNHISQPTFTRPALAARYYSVLRRERARRHFRVVAADVLDTSNMRSYLRAFMRRAPRHARACGACTTTRTSTGAPRVDTRRMLATVPGEVWLTETGAIVKLGAAVRLLGGARGAPHALDVRPRGSLRAPGGAACASRVTRLYDYKWFGEPPGAHFDAGLVNARRHPARRVLGVRAARAAAPLSARVIRRASSQPSIRRRAIASGGGSLSSPRPAAASTTWARDEPARVLDLVARVRLAARPARA